MILEAAAVPPHLNPMIQSSSMNYQQHFTQLIPPSPLEHFIYLAPSAHTFLGFFRLVVHSASVRVSDSSITKGRHLMQNYVQGWRSEEEKDRVAQRLMTAETFTGPCKGGKETVWEVGRSQVSPFPTTEPLSCVLSCPCRGPRGLSFPSPRPSPPAGAFAAPLLL